MGSSLSFGLQVMTTVNAQVDIQNNLISSTMTHDEAAIINFSVVAPNSKIDSNVYHGQAINPYVFDGAEYADLTDYQMASGYDDMSLTKQVSYVDVLTGNLHLSPGQYNDPDLLVAAAPGVVFDVDGETRLPLATHKGADDLDAEIIFQSSFELASH